MNDVTICNLALGHLGDIANVKSINPPDQSVQAQLCKRFYPAARNALLEMSSWGFATVRAKLAQVGNPTLAIAQGVDPAATQGTWQFAYALPNDVINVISVLPAAAIDDYEARFWPFDQTSFPPFPQGYVPVPGALAYTPQPFVMETLADGTQIILTNACNGVLRFTRAVTDTTKYSPLFSLALSHFLASMLAGPLIKGETGAAEAKQQLALFKAVEGWAEASDANQRKLNIEPSPSWIRGR